MEKIVLKDGTEISITGATPNSITIPYDDDTFMTTYGKLTIDNLEEYKVESATGDVMAIIKDKKVKSVTIEGDSVIIVLSDVDNTSKRITALEQEVESLTGCIMEMGQEVYGA